MSYKKKENVTLIRPLKWKLILCVTPHVAAAEHHQGGDSYIYYVNFF